jgi:ABC-type multidrug transport system fused ATPase/permease subunit
VFARAALGLPSLVKWFGEWSYGFFRDNDHSNGIKVGAEWRQALRRELRLAQVLVCLYSDEYDSSPWCVSELAIALEKGKTVIPILLLGRYVRRLSRSNQDRVAEVSSQVDEAMHEIRTVQAYGHEPRTRAASVRSGSSALFSEVPTIA